MVLAGFRTVAMRILVTFAVEAEFAPWREARKFRVADSALDAYESMTGDAKICVVLTGIGCKRTWDITSISCWGEDRFDVCISSGLAGGLRPEYSTADVLVAGAIRDYKGRPPLACDPDLVKKAVSCGAKFVEAFYMSDRILVSKEEKQAVAHLGDAVDMESRIVVGRSMDKGLVERCVAIRAISDCANEALPLNLNQAVDDAGNISLKKVLKELAQQPLAMPSLIRFGVNSRKAAATLAILLERYISSLARTPAEERLQEVAGT